MVTGQETWKYFTFSWEGGDLSAIENGSLKNDFMSKKNLQKLLISMKSNQFVHCTFLSSIICYFWLPWHP